MESGAGRYSVKDVYNPCSLLGQGPVPLRPRDPAEVFLLLSSHTNPPVPKRYASVVDDGDPNFPYDLFYPTREQMKRRLADRVDASKYLR